MSETPEHRCTAKAKSTGNRCKRTAIPGGTVCRYHGGAAPQVAKAARRRLLELVDPAISALAKVLEEDPELLFDEKGRPYLLPSAGERIRASEAILDRTGYPRRSELDIHDARSRLIERLRTETEADR